MLTTDTLTARRAALIAERENQTARWHIADRQAADRIAALEQQLSQLRTDRGLAERSYRERDTGYGAAIGELDRLLAENAPPAAEDAPKRRRGRA